ncbi:MAG: hypothetical protein ACK4GT_17940 [Pararhodobacter sp.]
MRLATISILIAALGLPAAADTSGRFRIVAQVPIQCEMGAASVSLAASAGGHLAGSALYSCNTSHMLAIGFGSAAAGSVARVGDRRVVLGPSGSAEIYVPGRHSGALRIELEDGAASGAAHAVLAVQPV